ncbi:TPA: 8-oxoguanine glycosylase ogg1 [Trebouxia sp. C0004]
MAAWYSHLHRTLARPCLRTGPSKPYILFSTSSLVCQRLHTAQHKLGMALATATSASAHSVVWQSLGAAPAELTLDFTLPTGQSFRWRQTGQAEFTGVVDNRVVKVQQTPSDVRYQVIARGDSAACSEDAAVLRNYFNLQACLEELSQEWSSRDSRYKSLHSYFPGARVLRQDPVECLFEFICSSNNHISRIFGMVERLCRDYGTPILHASMNQASTAAAPVGGKDTVAAAEEEQKAVPDLAFYSFPTLEQLSAASEAALRAEGFGYRAKFITGTVQALLAKPGGGRQWLYNLRNVPYKEASEALCELPGIGPKVAACICLFALDKHEAIPVDTHVWQLAVRYYTPHLKGKTMNKKIMVAVEDAFIERFGPWAGWAHNTLFISELATQRERLPEHLRPGGKSKASKSRTAAKGSTEEVSDQTEIMKVEQAAVQKHGLNVGVDAVDGNTKSRPVKRARRGAKHKKTDLRGIGNNGNTWQLHKIIKHGCCS